MRGTTLTLNKLNTDKVFTARHNAVGASILSQLKIPLQADPVSDMMNSKNAESSVEHIKIGHVENLRLFADDEWLPASASQIRSRTVFYLTLCLLLSVLHSNIRNSLLTLSIISDCMHV